ncbi:hypothetical protein PMI15_01422 [Polaromonas sp. CF318]|uniref:hypothetical protein n=1 Tax=Polaromonas sp. CF318 TaxID=1144318 RepID=UPI0002710104|nr:hypothetical protein [Polaromonas sp. CF318]EJL86575.1 hypothetical protein PMI15_01422 [Polaromonas sp. CF318]
MDFDLLHALCALGIVGIPLGVAWWSASRGKQVGPLRDDEADWGDPGEAAQATKLPWRSDL